MKAGVVENLPCTQLHKNLQRLLTYFFNRLASASPMFGLALCANYTVYTSASASDSTVSAGATIHHYLLQRPGESVSAGKTHACLMSTDTS